MDSDPTDIPAPSDADAVRALWRRHSVWRISGAMLFGILAGYVPGPAIMASFYMRDMADLQGAPPEGLIVGAMLLLAYFAGLGLLLFYAAFGAYRYAPVDDGIRVRSVFGTRHIPWKAVTRATLQPAKGAHVLVLRTGRFRGVRICLSDFRQPRSLLEAIRPLLPVPIHAAESHLALISDP